MGQVLHGYARTAETVRRAIQLRQESVRTLARRFGVSPIIIHNPGSDRSRPRGRPGAGGNSRLARSSRQGRAASPASSASSSPASSSTRCRDRRGQRAVRRRSRSLVTLRARCWPGCGRAVRHRAPHPGERKLQRRQPGGTGRDARWQSLPPVAGAGRVQQRLRPAPLPLRPANIADPLLQCQSRERQDRLRAGPSIAGHCRPAGNGCFRSGRSRRCVGGGACSSPRGPVRRGHCAPEPHPVAASRLGCEPAQSGHGLVAGRPSACASPNVRPPPSLWSNCPGPSSPHWSWPPSSRP